MDRSLSEETGNMKEAAGMQHLHPDVLKVSQISTAITHAVLFALAAAYLIAAYNFDWPFLPGWIAGGLFLVTFVLYVWVLPVVALRRFAFAVKPEEIEIRSGLVFINEVLVPMTKVQQVELESGPLMRKFGLAEVKVVTGASTVRIKGLKRMDAEALKQRIGVLARVEDRHE